MLPPGHIAAGYITAFTLVRVWPYPLDNTHISTVLIAGMAIGFAPDLDQFVSFIRSRTCKILSANNHRRYFSHTPLVWLLASLILFGFAQDSFQRLLALLVWLASWSHFLGDSLQYGIMWLYPFSKKLYSLKDTEVEFATLEQKFFSYWRAFVRHYATRFRLTFIVEILVVAAALIISFTSK